LQSYQDFGDDFDVAIDRAEQRILAIQSSAQDLAKNPYQGTLRPDILNGLRFVRQNKAVYWFFAHEERKTVQVLAIFYGGQDHTRQMLTCLLSN
jgi:plasmid stabilization system protein ParE